MFLIYLCYIEVFNLELLFRTGDNNKNVNPTINLGAQVEINKEAGEQIANSIGAVGRNIGLAGSIGGLAAAAAKAISHSYLPPLQKVAAVGLAGTGGAGIFVAGSALNKAINGNPTASSSNDSSGAISSINSGAKILLQTVPLLCLLASEEVIYLISS